MLISAFNRSVLFTVYPKPRGYQGPPKPFIERSQDHLDLITWIGPIFGFELEIIWTPPCLPASTGGRYGEDIE